MRLLVAILFSFLIAHGANKPQQAIVVTSADWSAPEGTLQRYERIGKQWHRTGAPISIKLGRNGMGWGIGLHKNPNDGNPVKREGDGKSPAGIFALKQAFGYYPFKATYPYKVYRETDHCVDDVNSQFYNKIVDSTAITVDYNSHENMKFPKDYYKYGIVVDHNPKGIRGSGSCIFLHIKEIPTAGCTVMTEAQMTEIIRWLDPSKHPILVQAPRDTIGKLFAY